MFLKVGDVRINLNRVRHLRLPDEPGRPLTVFFDDEPIGVQFPCDREDIDRQLNALNHPTEPPTR